MSGRVFKELLLINLRLLLHRLRGCIAIVILWADPKGRRERIAAGISQCRTITLRILFKGWGEE